MHHFAHYKSEVCKYGYETSLHLAAKQMIANAKELVIPPVFLSFQNSYKDNILLSESKTIRVDEVFLEQSEGNMIPDIVVINNGKKLFIEIYVTHSIDDEKLLKLKGKGVSTIEINLSKFNKSINREELREIVLNGVELKNWKYNSFADKYLMKFMDFADYKRNVYRGFAIHVDNCPIRMREWRGKSYANMIDDCLYCEFCISNAYREGILCSGKNRVATRRYAKDFR